MPTTINTYDNKASILARMMDLAANLHGVSKAELLDPVIILFIESLAEEIYRLSSEVDNIGARVIDKLSNILVAEIETMAHPAHSLLHAAALENKVALTTTTSFHCRHQHTNKKHELEFYPVCNTLVYKGTVKCFVHDRYFYSIDTELTKTLLTRGGKNSKEHSNSFWIGVELDDSINNLENLSFYLNFSRGYESQENQKQLTHLKWRFDNEEIVLSNGLYEIKEQHQNRHLELFFDYNHSNRVNKKIKKQYDKHFISIAQELNVENRKEKLPKQLVERFPESFCQTLDNDLLWFEISCPSDFTEEMIRAIEVGMNIFPVSSKKLVSRTLEVIKQIPIVPIDTENDESFLSVHSLSDSSGINFHDIPLNDVQDTQYGIYTMRHGGYEKFSRRDAKEFLSNMVSRIDAESASFFRESEESKSEQTVLKTDINKMIRTLNKANTSSKEHKEVKNYLLVEQAREHEIYFLKYWITNTTVSATVREGTAVKAGLGVGTNPSTSVLLKPMSSGKQTPSQSEKYSLYKESLTEHPLIISDDDIEQFCLKEFSEIVNRVEIKQGYEKSEDPQIGFLRTTDVQLYLHKQKQNKINQDTDLLIRDVLQKRSPATFNYRIIIK